MGQIIIEDPSGKIAERIAAFNKESMMATMLLDMGMDFAESIREGVEKTNAVIKEETPDAVAKIGAQQPEAIAYAKRVREIYVTLMGANIGGGFSYQTMELARDIVDKFI